MNVFLTGATGYIGGAIADALQRTGHRVLGNSGESIADEESPTDPRQSLPGVPPLNGASSLP